MTRIVISQPMFFPWVGLLEQIRLADVYVHYDDVQFSKGSFTNRVQVKTARGPKWLSLPVHVHLGDTIAKVRLADDGWRSGHISFLAQALDGAPYLGDALALVEAVYEKRHEYLADLVIASMDAVLQYFELCPATQFVRSSELGLPGKSWERVLEIVKHFKGDVYVTGHGARQYLDHEAFERSGVAVEYLDYKKHPYRQLHGDFTPHVSALDLIANLGRAGREVISSPTTPWRDFVRADT